MVTTSKYSRLGMQPWIYPHIQRRAKTTMSAETQSEIEFLLNDNIRLRKFSGSQQENTAHWARDAPEKRWTRLRRVFHSHYSVTKQLNGFPSAFSFPKKCFPFEWGRAEKQMFSNSYFSSFVFPGWEFVVLWGCGVRFREVFCLQLHFFGGRDRQYQPWQTWHKDMI